MNISTQKNSLQLMFNQSVTVRGSGFPLFATYVAVFRAAWRDITVSLKEKKITLYFSTNVYNLNMNSRWATDLRRLQLVRFCWLMGKRHPDVEFSPNRTSFFSAVAHNPSLTVSPIRTSFLSSCYD